MTGCSPATPSRPTGTPAPGADAPPTTDLALRPARPALLDRLPLGSGARRVAANALWLTGSRLLGLVYGILVSALVARYLGPQRYGLYVYVMTVVAFVQTLGMMGLDPITVRALVREPQSADETLGTTAALRSLGAVCTLALTCIVIAMLRPNEPATLALGLLLAAGALFQPASVVDLWFQSQVQARRTATRGAIVLAAAATANVLGVVLHRGIWWFATVATGQAALSAAVQIILYRRHVGPVRSWCWSQSRARALLSDSWPNVVSALAIVIYMKIDAVMLGQMASYRSVGMYSVAVRVTEAWHFIPVALSSSSLPMIVAARDADPALYKARMQRFMDAIVLAGLAVVVPTCLMGPWLVRTLFGPQYHEAGAIVSLHIWSALMVFLGVGANAWYIAENLLRLSMIWTIVGAITNVLLNLWLIPAHGAYGAAIATVTAYAIPSFLGNAILRSTRPIMIIQLRALANAPRTTAMVLMRMVAATRRIAVDRRPREG